ncbi:MAG TPA: arsenite S-adenosylmethyltransferase, partial [Baekduia sp.]|nr:arsenite S-adenosylmethyltransferase [Baekduia sp.]
MTDSDTLRDIVRDRYAASARAVAGGTSSSCGDGSCCGAPAAVIPADQVDRFGGALYADDDR